MARMSPAALGCVRPGRSASHDKAVALAVPSPWNSFPLLLAVGDSDFRANRISSTRSSLTDIYFTAALPELSFIIARSFEVL